jgi:hypothetical protein
MHLGLSLIEQLTPRMLRFPSSRTPAAINTAQERTLPSTRTLS